MNAAARALAQGSLNSIGCRSFMVTSQLLGVMLLIIAVLASAVSVVYVKNLNRHLFSELQTLTQSRDELRIEGSQLLLEQNTWAASTRVQTIAEQQLGMSLPSPKDVVLVALDKITQ